VNGQLAGLKVITYEELVSEERTRQVAAAVLDGLAAGANAAAASRAGYYSHNTTVYTPRGTYTATTTGYSPAAAAIAQSNATAQNEAMIGATIERGQQNLAMLEQAVMKTIRCSLESGTAANCICNRSPAQATAESSIALP